MRSIGIWVLGAASWVTSAQGLASGLCDDDGLVSPVELDQPLRGAVSGGECRVFTARGGQPLLVSVLETDIDLELLVPGPAGTIVLDNDLNGDWVEAGLIGAGGGPGRVAVRSKGTTALKGAFDITVQPLDPADPGDRLLIEAGRANMSALGVRIGEQPDAPAPADRLAKLEAAAAAWRRAGRPLEEAVALLAGGIVAAYDLDEGSEGIARAGEAVSVLTRAGMERHRLRSLLQLGELRMWFGDPARAEAELARGLTEARATGDASLAAMFHSRLGLVAHVAGRLDEALFHYDQARTLLVEDPSPALAATLANNVAGIYHLRGPPSRALQAYDEAIELAGVAGQQWELATMLRNRAFLKLRLGEYSTALASFSEALDVFRDLGDSAEAAICLQGVADVYHRLGDLERATATLETARASVSADGSLGVAEDLDRSLARVYRDDGRVAEALELHKALLADAETKGEAPGLARAHLALAEDYLRGEQWSAARLHARQSEDLFRSLGFRQELARALEATGVAAAGLGELGPARTALRESLSISEELEVADERIQTMVHLGRVHEALGEIPLAVELNERAADLADRVVGQVGSPELRARSFGVRLSPYDELIRLRLAGSESEDPDAAARASLTIAERARARSLKEAVLREGGENLFGESGRDAKRLLAAINDRLLDLHRLNDAADRADGTRVSKGADSERDLELRIQGLKDELSVLRLEFDALWQASGAPGMSLPGDGHVAEVDYARLQEYSESGALILIYHVSPAVSYVWTIQAGHIHVETLPPAAELTEAVGALLASARVWHPDPARYERAVADASALLLGHLDATEGADRLIVIPDGVLYRAPFAMLRLPDRPGRWLSEELELTIVPSLVLMKGESGAVESRIDDGALLVLADPAIDANPVEPDSLVREAGLQGSATISGLGPLPYSREEADSLAESASGRRVDLLLGEDARKPFLLGTSLTEYSIVHFATHAIVGSSPAEYSGLVLARSADSPLSDGFLHLGEIYGLRLDARLVVLSACRSGAGRIVRGEGPFSLGRAFLIAGADRVLMTQWDVSDEATARFMSVFYAAILGDGLDPSAALRHAQLHFQTDPVLSHPFYWAGFFITQLGVDG